MIPGSTFWVIMETHLTVGVKLHGTKDRIEPRCVYIWVYLSGEYRRAHPSFRKRARTGWGPSPGSLGPDQRNRGLREPGPRLGLNPAASWFRRGKPALLEALGRLAGFCPSWLGIVLNGSSLQVCRGVTQLRARGLQRCMHVILPDSRPQLPLGTRVSFSSDSQEALASFKGCHSCSGVKILGFSALPS